MDGKIHIGTRNTSYSFTDGTRVITLTGLQNAITEISRLYFVYNDTQKVLYYAPYTAGSLVTVSGSNELTIDSSFAVLATGDKLKIQIWEESPLEDYTSEAMRGYEIDARKNWYDTVAPLATNQAFTAAYVSLGSEFAVEKYRKIRFFFKSEHGSSTDLRIKFLGRYTIADANVFPLTAVSNTDVTEVREIATGFRCYELNNDTVTTQYHIFDVDVSNGLASIEVQIKCNGTLSGTTRMTGFYIRTFN